MTVWYHNTTTGTRKRSGPPDVGDSSFIFFLFVDGVIDRLTFWSVC